MAVAPSSGMNCATDYVPDQLESVSLACYLYIIKQSLNQRMGNKQSFRILYELESIFSGWFKHENGIRLTGIEQPYG